MVKWLQLSLVFLCLVIYTGLGFGDLSTVSTLFDRYFQETPEQRNAWQLAEKYCTPIDTNETLDEPCISALTTYFLDQPVWAYDRSYYFSQAQKLEQIPI